MPGPLPKSAATRQRRNPSPGTTLARGAKAAAIPELPVVGRRKWHPMTESWWHDAWSDPMSAEYVKSDKHGFFMLAELVDRFWKLSANNPQRVKLMTEIRMQGQRFGLSPLDRQRLRWEVERGEEAAARTATRKQQRAATRARATATDPRDLLKVVGE